MGIPKFYRWISERYPCLSEKIREYQIPDFDNLYLDMNGIIHTCSHPNDDDVHLRIPEEAVFKEIFRYIDFLFKMIKPRKVFFMAIDGVAPRAKMNQQRGRRFRSAKLALDQEAEAVKKGEKLPSEERFDSNCITPGTEFMARLHEQLQYFVKVKVSTDSLWQREGLVIYLSGHDVPGEGEHKIMDYIRHIRSQPNYDAETRHCLYGLDADLIMLGLSTHELHFSLLREEVKFGPVRKRRRPQPPPSNPEKKAFDLNSVSVFKAPEVNANGESSNSNTGTEAIIVSTDSALQSSLSYAGAAKLEATVVDATPKPESEVARIEKQLIPPPNDAERKKKDAYHPPLPEKTTFLLLHLSLLRDYLDEEFSVLKERLEGHPTIEYNLENIIDDWILMCILVGNDFVPNLPHLHITTNALPMVYSKYVSVLPTLSGYINENGHLNLDRFETFLREISTHDVENFRASYDDMKYMASKTGKNIVLGDTMMEAFEFDDNDGFKEEAIDGEEEAPKSGVMSELQALISRTEESVFGALADSDENEDAPKKGETSLEAFPTNDDIFEEDDSPELRLEFAQSKRHYYMTKMDFKDVQKEVRQLAIEYIRAVQWVLLYYYKGVSSWCWYYPAHYAPFTSDLRNFRDIRITFDKGQPFRPFEQLLGVLPAQSKKLLPDCYQWLMTHAESPIINYYPEKFEQDLNGKKQDWEAVILIPFIDEKLLLNAMHPEAPKLSDHENFRNVRGQLLVYSYLNEDTGAVDSPGSKFPSLPSSHYKVVGLDDVPYDPVTLPRGIHPKAKTDTVYQGFPTIKTMPHRSYLMDAQVKVFDMQARDLSMVLDLNLEEEEEEEQVTKKNSVKTEELAKSLLDSLVWVNWPHLTPALVTAVADSKVKYVKRENSKDPVIDPKHSPSEHATVVEGLVKRHMGSKAIKLTETQDIVFWAKLMDGRKVRCDRTGRVIVENLWQHLEQPFAYETTITDDSTIAVFSITSGKVSSFVDLFRPGDIVFTLEKDLFGAKAIVKEHDEKRSKLIVEYNIPVYKDINGEAEKDIFSALRKWNYNNYFSTHEAARMCNLDPFTFSKLSGCIFVTVEKGQSPKKKSKGFGKRRNRDKPQGEEEGSKSDSDDDIHLAQETKKVNVGLDLKFNKRNQKARGYTTKDAGDRGGKWAYSSKTVKLVQEYVQQFPRFVRYLSTCQNGNRNMDNYKAEDIYPEDPIGNMKRMQDWVDGLGLRYSVQRVDISSDILDDDEIQIIWNHILGCKINAKPDIVKTKSIPPNKVYKPGLNRGSVQPVQGQSFEILDRIVCVDQSATMPVGQRGTVVGIQEPQVKGNEEAIEESFKATNATLLQTLIILPDPQPDVFDKVSDDNNSSTKLQDSPNGIVKKDIKLALNQFLGLTAKEEDDVPQVRVEEKQQQPSEEYKPLPRLVKLFPYQVIQISHVEVETYEQVRTKTAIGQQESKPCETPRGNQQQRNGPNYGNKKIPPLFAPETSFPAKGKVIKAVPVPGNKYPNFVKATPDAPSNNSGADSSDSRRNEDKLKETKKLESLLDSAFVGQNKPKKQLSNNVPKPKVKQTSRAEGDIGPASKSSNNSNQSRPIVILKRPQQLDQQQKNISTSNHPQTSAVGNPIFSLLESSLEQHRATEIKRDSRKDQREKGRPDTKDARDKPRSDGRPKESQVQRSEKSREDTKKAGDRRQQPNKSRSQPNQNEQQQQQQQQHLLQLLQQLPNSQQAYGRNPAMNFPQPPAGKNGQPLMVQQHLFRPPFSAPHNNVMQQQFVQNGVLIRQPQILMTQQGPVVIPVQIPTPLIHPSMLQQPQAPPMKQQHSQSAPKNPKTTTSFVPTQVLSGGRGTSSFTGGSKKYYKSSTPSSNNTPFANAPASSSAPQEMPIDDLLAEAAKNQRSRNHSTDAQKVTEKNQSNEKAHSNAGADLLSQLTSNFHGFGMTEPANQPVTQEEESDTPRKSRLAANFNFGGQ